MDKNTQGENQLDIVDVAKILKEYSTNVTSRVCNEIIVIDNDDNDEEVSYFWYTFSPVQKISHASLPVVSIKQEPPSSLAGLTEEVLILIIWLSAINRLFRFLLLTLLKGLLNPTLIFTQPLI